MISGRLQISPSQVCGQIQLIVKYVIAKAGETRGPRTALFLKKVEIFISLEVLYLCSDCKLNLTGNSKLTKICDFFLAAAIFEKSTFKDGRHCHDC